MKANELLAAYAHEAWAGWMKYLFSRCMEVDGHLVIPPSLVKRWKRQMATPYDGLPEAEKDSDRAEAIKIQRIFFGHEDDPER